MIRLYCEYFQFLRYFKTFYSPNFFYFELSFFGGEEDDDDRFIELIANKYE